MLKNFFIRLIRVYQRFLSPFLGQHCRFHPSCSEYCCSAIKKHGLFKGLGLTGWRIMRCNPYLSGGVDYP